MNTPLDSEYWNSRYLNNEAAWDTGEITTPLKTYFDGLSDKEMYILIPGAGYGYEAEYLFNAGYKNVFVCDIALAPLEAIQKRCPGFNSSNLLLQNFFELDLNSDVPYKKGFDLIVEQTFFCAIDPKLRPKYFPQIKNLLCNNGRLVGVMFDDVLNIDKPPFGGSKTEYQSYFKGLFKTNKFESCYNSINPRAGRELFINLEKKASSGK